ncbi:MAG: ROK family protein [Solirubrobacteraceae bacterium]
MSGQAPASDHSLFIGVDLGGTKMSIGTLRAGHSFGEPTLTPTEHSGQEALLDSLLTGIRQAIGRADGPVRAVGLGIPSVVDFATGTVRASVNVPLQDLPLRAVLRDRLDGLPVFVDNDATCAALAESHDQHGRLDAANLVMVTVGTGVGGGIVIDGRPYRGATGAAGEVGHTILSLDLSAGAHASGGFPRAGSLESLASGLALDALARSVAEHHTDSALGLRASSGDQPVRGPDLVDAARRGDRPALDALALFGERLGVGVANLINIFDPDVLAIGGGASAAGDLLLEPAVQSAKRFVLPGVGTRTEIRIARSGPLAGVHGAALLASIESARAAGPS